MGEDYYCTWWSDYGDFHWESGTEGGDYWPDGYRSHWHVEEREVDYKCTEDSYGNEDCYYDLDYCSYNDCYDYEGGYYDNYYGDYYAQAEGEFYGADRVCEDYGVCAPEEAILNLVAEQLGQGDCYDGME